MLSLERLRCTQVLYYAWDHLYRLHHTQDLHQPCTLGLCAEAGRAPESYVSLEPPGAVYAIDKTYTTP